MKSCIYVPKNGRLIAVWFTLLISVMASAQVQEAKDKLYLDVLGGVNHSMNENTDNQYEHSSGFSSFGDAVGVGATIGVGKEWNRLLGWHFSLGYNSNKGRATFYNKQRELYNFLDVETFGDLTFDITDWIFPKRKNKTFNLKGMLGAGLLQTFSFDKEELSYSDHYSTTPRLCWGFRGGLQARYAFTSEMALAANLTLTAMQDKFSGVDRGFPLDGRLNFSIGMIWHLRIGKETPGPAFAQEVPIVEPVVKSIEISYEITPTMAYVVPEKDAKMREFKGSAFIDYPVNDTRLYPTFRNNPVELRKVRNSIDDVALDTLSTIQGITLHGYASPEGSYRNNQRLSEGRAATMKKYIEDTFRLSDTIIAHHSTPEDWDGLREYISSGDLTSKEEFLAIIDKEIDPDLKLQEMKTVNATEYDYLAEGIFPRLRRCDYTILYVVRNLTLEETRRLYDIKPSALSLREFYDLACDYGQGNREFGQVILSAAKEYPDSEVANLNAACVLIERNNLDEAKNYLALAGNSPEVIHAKGVVAMLENDYDNGLSLLKSSANLGVKESQQVLDTMKKYQKLFY